MDEIQKLGPDSVRCLGYGKFPFAKKSWNGLGILYRAVCRVRTGKVCFQSAP